MEGSMPPPKWQDLSSQKLTLVPSPSFGGLLYKLLTHLQSRGLS
jgi:hypothetical protein